MPNPKFLRHWKIAAALPTIATLSSCAAIGSMLTSYPEHFACKNRDHGQCISPDKAYADAAAGRAPRSDSQVTRDKMLLGPQPGQADERPQRKGKQRQTPPYLAYRDSVYSALKDLVDAPVTPMLTPPRTVRTLILPYAQGERPDRLYMPRFVYSMVDRPRWVVGDYLVDHGAAGAKTTVLEQIEDKHDATGAMQAEPRP